MILSVLVLAGVVGLPGGTSIATASRNVVIDQRFVPNGVGFWTKDRGLIGGHVGRRGVVARTRDGGSTLAVESDATRPRGRWTSPSPGDRVAWIEVEVCRACHNLGK
jgi:hypothetical protein